MKKYKMYIDGEFTEAISGKTYLTENPATGEIVGEIPLGNAEDVDKAVKAAKAAFPEWSAKSMAERSDIINRVADELDKRSEELAQLDVIDHGTPISLGRMWEHAGVSNLRYTASAARALMGDSIPMRPNAIYNLERQPIGVCGLIIPWNSPILMVTSKLGACLATGNTCVMKPASISSLVTLVFAEILDSCGVPSGVVNIVTGPGGSVGEAIAKNRGIEFISFTGSSETGKSLMASASCNLKRLHMELGGKNPFIVLEDADIDNLAIQGARSTCNNSGMVCASPGRYYLHEKIHDRFVDKFVGAMRKVLVGDPSDVKTEMGPVVSEEHRNRVERYIKSGIDEGAQLLLGGERLVGSPFDNGYYVLPTVFRDVTPDMTIFREEIFGPVGVCVKFSSDEEVIASANDTEFGLCGTVWTKDLKRGLKIVSKIDAGAVGVNTGRFVSGETPWGGFKESGFGKENSMYGLEEYTRIKMMVVDFN